MNRICVTEIEKIDQNGSINRAEIEVLTGDKPDNMELIRNLVTVAHLDEETLHVEFFQEDDGISLMVELPVGELEESATEVDLLVLGQAPIRAMLKDITEENTIIISSLFEDLTLKEDKEYFLQSIIYANNNEDYAAIVGHLKKEDQATGTINFDIAQIVESLNVNQVVEGVKKHMREEHNPTHRSDLQLEHTLVASINLAVGAVKFSDMVRIQKEKESLQADYPETEVLEDSSEVDDSASQVE